MSDALKGIITIGMGCGMLIAAFVLHAGTQLEFPGIVLVGLGGGLLIRR